MSIYKKTRPVFAAVVSEDIATILFVRSQSVMASAAAFAVCSQVPCETFGMAKSFSLVRPVTTTAAWSSFS
jgi:hypothetical protein